MQSQVSIEEIQNFKGKYPKQIWGLFFSEMWERFCFYGMRGILVIFMISKLQLQEKEANLQYGAIQAFVYAFTFIGGLFADKILGFRKSLFWGGFMMIVGSSLLAFNPHDLFFMGISFTVIGTGFFKPNISSMVGYLYKADDNRRDAGFSLFYAGINLGALIGGYLCVAIGKGQMFTSLIEENHRWNVAFGLAAIVMIISLISFIFTQKSLGEIGLKPNHNTADVTALPKKQIWKEYAVYIGSLMMIPVIMKMVAITAYTDYFMYTIGPLTLIYLGYEMAKCTAPERKKLLAALIFILFSILFWGIYEQAGGSLSIFATNNLNDQLIGGLIHLDPNGVNNSGGSFFIIFFAPLLGLVWLALGRKKAEPNTIVKFGLAFIFLALGYYVIFCTRFFANAQGIASLDVFTFALFAITLGELCLSPIGLSIMTKLSTKNLQGMMMGMWFLASAYGQYVAGQIGAQMAENQSKAENADILTRLFTYTEGYKTLALYAVIAGIILLLISPFVKKLMQEVK